MCDSSVCHLVKVVFFDDAGGSQAEQLSGIVSFVSRGDLFSVPQVQCTATQVQTSNPRTADMSEVILATCEVTWSTK